MGYIFIEKEVVHLKRFTRKTIPEIVYPSLQNSNSRSVSLEILLISLEAIKSTSSENDHLSII